MILLSTWRDAGFSCLTCRLKPNGSISRIICDKLAKLCASTYSRMNADARVEWGTLLTWLLGFLLLFWWLEFEF